VSIFIRPLNFLSLPVTDVRARRATHHIKHLLDLIKQFPRVNPSPSNPSDLDIPKLFRQIRSRYKALCSTLGVKPSLRAAETSPSREQAEDGAEAGSGRSVWALETQAKKSPSQGLDF
jgi:hypothetical protein